MRTVRVSLCLALTLAATEGLAAENPKISDGVVKIGVLTDMTGYYSDLAGPGSVLAAKMAAEDAGGKVLGVPIEIVSADHQLKGGRRVQHRPQVVRPGQGRRGRGPRLLVDRARGDAGREREEEGDAPLGAGHDRHHRREVHAVQLPLDLQQLVARERHRPRGREDRRRHLVLHHRRLRVREVARGGHEQRREGCGRQGARRRAAPVARHDRLLVLPAPGPGLRREDHRPRERRRRHGELHQAGGGVRDHAEAEPGRPARVHQRHPQPRPQGRAGHVPHDVVLLGS